jgi:hypothetical protein
MFTIGLLGLDIARGPTKYNAEEARRILGHASQQIETPSGYGGDADRGEVDGRQPPGHRSVDHGMSNIASCATSTGQAK